MTGIEFSFPNTPQETVNSTKKAGIFSARMFRSQS